MEPMEPAVVERAVAQLQELVQTQPYLMAQELASE
jgi:hypothetical protein